MQTSSFVFTLNEISDILRSMYNDVDHQVRSQALNTLGNVIVLMGGNISVHQLSIEGVWFKLCVIFELMSSFRLYGVLGCREQRCCRNCSRSCL